MQTQLSQDQELLNLKRVCQITGYSRASIYRFIHSEGFPAQLRVGPNKVVWPKEAVLNWRTARIEKFSQLLTSNQGGLN